MLSSSLWLPHPFAAVWRRVGKGNKRHDPHSFSLSRCPLAFHFHSTFAAGTPLAKTAPLPLLRSGAQSPLHRITVNITKLFYSLFLAPHREIVVPHLPKPRHVSRRVK